MKLYKSVRQKRPKIRPAFACAITLVALLYGCSQDPTSPTPTAWYKRTEPRYVLADVAIALREGNRAGIEACLAPDFVFYFDPAEIGKTYAGYTVPVYWDRAAFVAAGEAFLSEVDSMDVDNEWETCGTPAAGETTYYSPNHSFWAEVIMRGGTGYRLDEGQCHYAFMRDDAGKWALTKWWDRTYGCGCAGVTISWGQLLIRYGRRT